MRPIRPDRAEYPKIKKAMRAARFMKWGALPLAGLAMLAAIGIGASTVWYFGVGAFIVAWSALFIVGYSASKCPRCGQVWLSNLSMLAFAPWWASLGSHAESGDETETFVCRRCRLDIGLGLRE